MNKIRKKKKKIYGWLHEQKTIQNRKKERKKSFINKENKITKHLFHPQKPIYLCIIPLNVSLHSFEPKCPMLYVPSYKFNAIQWISFNVYQTGENSSYRLKKNLRKFSRGGSMVECRHTFNSKCDSKRNSHSCDSIGVECTIITRMNF